MTLNTAFVTTLEALLAAMVLLEIVILFSGVVSRYVFHNPIVWSDELAGVVFIWLAMLGSVLALEKNMHMRMTAMVSRLQPAQRGFFESIGFCVVILFVLMLLGPSLRYAASERGVITPGLNISNAWQAAALPCGLILMLFVAFQHVLKMHSRRMTLVAVVVVAALCVVFVLLRPVFADADTTSLIVFFVVLVPALVLCGVPIAFCFGLATAAYLQLVAEVPLMVVVGRMDEGMTNGVLLAIPMFIFLGGMITLTGMAHAMVAFLVSVLGHVRGGLSYVLIVAMYLVSGISGAKAADMAAIVPALFPDMKRRGARPGELVALLCATSAQTETIPPSLVLITVGSVTGVSIAALFRAGLLPALFLGGIICAVVYSRSRRENLSGVARPSLSKIARALVISIPALILPFVIRAAVLEGVATATEVATIGVVYSFVIGLVIYRQFSWTAAYRVLVETAELSAMILLIIGCATGMAWALTQSGFADDLSTAMKALPGGSTSFLLVSLVLFVVLGSLLEGIPAIVLFGPLLFPIAHSLGVNEVHYAIVVVLAMGIGLFAPPFGVGYYTACVIGKVDPVEGLRPIVGYLVALVIGIVVLALAPWLTTGSGI